MPSFRQKGLLMGVIVLTAYVVMDLSMESSLSSRLAYSDGATTTKSASSLAENATLLQEQTSRPLSDSVFPDAVQRNCIVAGSLCHSARRFFRIENEHMTTQQIDPRLATDGRVILRLYRPGKGKATGYPDEIEVEPYHPSMSNQSAPTPLQCTTSPVDNHIVLASWYNHMLGEFYLRALYGLFGTFFTANDTDTRKTAKFLEQSQMYLFLHDASKRHLLDSHHAFTSLFRGGNPLLDFRALLDDPRCRCLRRVVLCGYGLKEENETIVLAIGGGIAPSSRSEDGPPLWSSMHLAMRAQLIENNPRVLHDIEQHRMSILSFFQARSLIRHNNHTHYRILGLTQRSTRRKWMNLENILKRLRGPLAKKNVLLTSINVEDSDMNPYHQMVRHAALDGLIGIHGAQLTEAIWMKPESFVVEFLPHIIGSNGKWTATTHAPTPLGIIFHDTKLQHIGLPLTNASFPPCVTGSPTCAENKGWANRDYVVDPSQVQDLVERFLVGNPETCSDYVTAAQKDYVLYNI